MALTLNDRFFLRGSTVHMRVRVSEPGTKRPADATVALTSLKRGAVVVPVDNPTFSRINQGDHLLVLPTADLTPSTYEVVVTVSDGPSKVTVLTDRFVVKDL